MKFCCAISLMSIRIWYYQMHYHQKYPFRSRTLRCDSTYSCQPRLVCRTNLRRVLLSVFTARTFAQDWDSHSVIGGQKLAFAAVTLLLFKIEIALLLKIALFNLDFSLNRVLKGALKNSLFCWKNHLRGVEGSRRIQILLNTKNSDLFGLFS